MNTMNKNTQQQSKRKQKQDKQNQMKLNKLSKSKQNQMKQNQNRQNQHQSTRTNTITQSTILVTGGAGFIGSHLVDALSQQDQQNKVIIIDDLSTGKIENIAHFFSKDDIDDITKLKKQVKKQETKQKHSAIAIQNKKEEQKKDGWIECCSDDQQIIFCFVDIRNCVLLQKIFEKYTPDYVFHQAAIPSVPRSVRDPIASNEANVNGTINILNAARKNNVKKIVYAASSSAYGDTPTLPKQESMPPLPLSPYAVSKLAGELYCKAFYEVYGLNYVCLRYFNVFGPRQDPKSEYAAVIPKFITLIQDGKSPVIFGDGEQTRDFTFVSDVVQANIKAAVSDAIGMFNVAGGKRISINQLAESIASILGETTIPTYEDARPGDVKHSLADISKANQAFNYQPRFDVQDGLEETIKWFQQQRNQGNK